MENVMTFKLEMADENYSACATVISVHFKRILADTIVNSVDLSIELISRLEKT